MSDVSIWLINEDNKLQLPFTELGGLGREREYHHDVVNLYKIGDVLVKGNSGLYSFSYSSHFPDQRYGYVEVSDLRSPYYYVDKIESFMNDTEPIRLVITGTKINMLGRITNFSYEERDSTGSVYYDISITEYKLPSKPKESTVGTYGLAERRPRTEEDNKLASGMAK